MYEKSKLKGEKGEIEKIALPYSNEKVGVWVGVWVWLGVLLQCVFVCVCQQIAGSIDSLLRLIVI